MLTPRRLLLWPNTFLLDLVSGCFICHSPGVASIFTTVHRVSGETLCGLFVVYKLSVLFIDLHTICGVCIYIYIQQRATGTHAY